MVDMWRICWGAAKEEKALSINDWADAWIADERGNRVNMETLYTETATDGAYYTLSLTNSSLTNVKTIYLANSYGAGETYKDENGSIWEVGETRDFYIDNISFVVKPTLFVDESVFDTFRYEGDTLSLPKEQIGNYTEQYACTLSYTLNGGETVVLDATRWNLPAESTNLRTA